MSLSTGIKSLETRIKRLEASAKKGQRYCAYCRFALRRSWPDPKKPKPSPEDVVKAKCEFCHSEYTVSLAEKSEEEREALRLQYSYTMEDQYIDPKAHALVLWLNYWPDRKQRQKKKGRAQSRPKANKRPLDSTFVQLRDEVGELIANKRKSLKSKYGTSVFPEQQQLIESVQNRERDKRKGVYVQGLFDLEMEETRYLICAELEKIIWGETRPGTASAIEKIGLEIDELIRTAAEAEERRKEEARLRNLEFLNKNRSSVGLQPLPDDYGRG